MCQEAETNSLCFDRQTAWKAVLARLQLLIKLIPIWGLAQGSEPGLPLVGLMKFVEPAFSSANADVRGAAVALVVKVCSHKTLCNLSQRRIPKVSLNHGMRDSNLSVSQSRDFSGNIT